MSPIRPENKDRYPKNWKQIRAQILERAENCCEECGVENGAIGFWFTEDEFVEPKGMDMEAATIDGEKIIKIVLTVAHLNHTPEDCDPHNLMALCQRCHNRYDAKNRAKNRSANRYKDLEKDGQERLL